MVRGERMENAHLRRVVKFGAFGGEIYYGYICFGV